MAASLQKVPKFSPTKFKVHTVVPSLLSGSEGTIEMAENGLALLDYTQLQPHCTTYLIPYPFHLVHRQALEKSIHH